MKKLLTLLLIVHTAAAYSQSTTLMPDDQEKPTERSEQVMTGEVDSVASEKIGVKEVKWPSLDTLLHSDSDTTYVINFWATWCGPCVKELPHFEALKRNYASHKVRILLVSMDFAKEIEDRVIPFVVHHKLKNTVWLLNEPDANSWIEKVDASWSGALPATLIINPARSKKAFFEKAFDYESLARELSYFVEY